MIKCQAEQCDMATSFLTQSDIKGLPKGKGKIDLHHAETILQACRALARDFDVALDKWPGLDRVNEIADQGCLERFPAAIGTSYEESVLYITNLVPTQGSWEQGDDREVVCVAYHMDLDKLTGSVLGTGM